MKELYRIRFKANPEDPRPINWPVKHPFWITGYSNLSSIVISYADDEQYIYDNWPEAKDLEIEKRGYYTFTSRFPRPDWFNNYCRSCGEPSYVRKCKNCGYESLNIGGK